MTNHYDVIIIGMGADGRTLAYRLAGSGKHILLLERGDFLPREKENWDARTVFAESLNFPRGATPSGSVT